MGLFSSKVNVAAIEAIEFNVSSLIIRLGEEEAKIEDYVKHRISKALFFYSNVVKNENRKGYISKRKMQKMDELISQAKNKLERLPTMQRAYESADGKSLYQMKSELFEIEKRLSSNKIKEDEYENIFHVVIMYSQHLEFHTKTPITQEQDDNLSLLVLKLFLKSPLVKTVNVLQHTLYNLHGATKQFEIFGANSVTVFNAEEVKKYLEGIKEKIETLNQVVKNLEQEVEEKGINLAKQHCHRSNTYISKPVSTRSSWSRKEENTSESLVSRYENLLKQVEIDLYEYDTVVDKFCSPIGDAAVENVKRKVLYILNNRLQKVPSEEELKIRKKVLFDKGEQIITKLEKINEENKEISENLKALAEVEEKLSTVCESNSSFREKQSNLEILIERVKRINTNNSEVVLQKNEIVNRIEGCLVVESMTFLRSLKKTLDNYKMYVRQFPYPKSVHLYEVKTAEILSLKQHLSNLPNGNRCIDKEVSFLLQQTDEVLRILDSKAKDNEDLLFLLQSLDYIASEINHQNQSHSSGVTKLMAFNNFRKRLNSVDGGSYKVSNKKMRILGELHVFEDRIYLEHYPKDVQNVKMLLNESEKSVYFTHATSSEEYDLKRREILNLWENGKVIMREKFVSYDFASVFNENFELVLKFLETAGKEAQDISDRIESLEVTKNEILSLSCKNLTISKKMELIEQKETLIQLMRKTFSYKVDVITALENIEKLIVLEKSKIEFSHWQALLSTFVKDMSHPLATDSVKQKLNEILYLNERVEDMPEGNAELDSLKRSFAQEVFDSLKKLDEFLAKLLVKSSKQPENIVDLQNHFNDFNLDTMNIRRESVEFIQMIRQRAESFETCVKYYLGTNYSVDYYVIHENLMRLLEELDRLTCEDGILINRVVDTVGYIKNLIEELDSNASSE
ncbi:centromere-associated protein E-like isoform X1 [Zophobas morio]|uniref:centromere-associated protein E-like isoform X1 n=1 Tax=Zophobas morio TaxID=2755281 RepID=UPI00308298B8